MTENSYTSLKAGIGERPFDNASVYLGHVWLGESVCIPPPIPWAHHQTGVWLGVITLHPDSLPPLLPPLAIIAIPHRKRRIGIPPNSHFLFRFLSIILSNVSLPYCKVLVLLNGEQPGGLASTSEKFLKAETTLVQMPDLIDTGDPDDYNGLDSSTKDQNYQNTTVRTTTPLIDDLLGDGIGTNLSTSELKNDDDPFADVSFHTTKGRKNVDDLLWDECR
ncbi:uncharacterized protein [Gossypium hirsutum]|uniref:Uncharacterized protein n=1 Tax=Gossypium hirsutum TaxID=3635 RepID=A0A1U8NQN7_GOSHI|nr:uncharacterized protein LOC107950736 [Gossypium hirsutum]